MGARVVLCFSLFILYLEALPYPIDLIEVRNADDSKVSTAAPKESSITENIEQENKDNDLITAHLPNKQTFKIVTEKSGDNLNKKEFQLPDSIQEIIKKDPSKRYKVIVTRKFKNKKKNNKSKKSKKERVKSSGYIVIEESINGGSKSDNNNENISENDAKKGVGKKTSSINIEKSKQTVPNTETGTEIKSDSQEQEKTANDGIWKHTVTVVDNNSNKGAEDIKKDAIDDQAKSTSDVSKNNGEANSADLQTDIISQTPITQEPVSSIGQLIFESPGESFNIEPPGKENVVITKVDPSVAIPNRKRGSNTYVRSYHESSSNEEKNTKRVVKKSGVKSRPKIIRHRPINIINIGKNRLPIAGNNWKFKYIIRDSDKRNKRKKKIPKLKEPKNIGRTKNYLVKKSGDKPRPKTDPNHPNKIINIGKNRLPITGDNWNVKYIINVGDKRKNKNIPKFKKPENVRRIKNHFSKFNPKINNPIITVSDADKLHTNEIALSSKYKDFVGKVTQAANRNNLILWDDISKLINLEKNLPETSKEAIELYLFFKAFIDMTRRLDMARLDALFGEILRRIKIYESYFNKPDKNMPKEVTFRPYQRSEPTFEETDVVHPGIYDKTHEVPEREFAPDSKEESYIIAQPDATEIRTIPIKSYSDEPTTDYITSVEQEYPLSGDLMPNEYEFEDILERASKINDIIRKDDIFSKDIDHDSVNSPKLNMGVQTIPKVEVLPRDSDTIPKYPTEPNMLIPVRNDEEILYRDIPDKRISSEPIDSPWEDISVKLVSDQDKPSHVDTNEDIESAYTYPATEPVDVSQYSISSEDTPDTTYELTPINKNIDSKEIDWKKHRSPENLNMYNIHITPEPKSPDTVDEIKYPNSEYYKKSFEPISDSDANTYPDNDRLNSNYNQYPESYKLYDGFNVKPWLNKEFATLNSKDTSSDEMETKYELFNQRNLAPTTDYDKKINNEVVNSEYVDIEPNVDSRTKDIFAPGNEVKHYETIDQENTETTKDYLSEIYKVNSEADEPKQRRNKPYLHSHSKDSIIPEVKYHDTIIQDMLESSKGSDGELYEIKSEERSNINESDEKGSIHDDGGNTKFRINHDSPRSYEDNINGYDRSGQTNSDYDPDKTLVHTISAIINRFKQLGISDDKIREELRHIMFLIPQEYTKTKCQKEAYADLVDKFQNAVNAILRLPY